MRCGARPLGCHNTLSGRGERPAFPDDREHGGYECWQDLVEPLRDPSFAPSVIEPVATKRV
ncbi:hypothetical protein ARGLB_037_00420 [Arthrobacter globiformis NBRC 12137]|uniref:Uncharacterized protein n=1 Tax=Arthrobacter globiformis (strain ATCC 8010 / DSM 20124 / JCM 1332 / NBRC 12137 / NCIMB 8907 / NRRL B-2979 / 168) TaxID=1077972 RepID=H0QKJ3_ARTG1|nr:hypothetical protein ARGLB_037_00420 [Arthrobacter globiformis NBRC 12137]